MEHRILPCDPYKLPGVEAVTPGTFLSLYGEQIDAPDRSRSRWTRRLIGFAYRIEPSLYRVWADDFSKIDPDNKGVSEADFEKVPTNLAKLRIWEVTGTAVDPITSQVKTVTRIITVTAPPVVGAKVDGVTVATCKPTIASEITGYGMKADLIKPAAIISEVEKVIK